MRWNAIFMNLKPDYCVKQIDHYAKSVIPISPATILIYISNYRAVCRIYRKVSNISRTLVGNKCVDHSDVVGASPVGAAPTTSSFST